MPPSRPLRTTPLPPHTALSSRHAFFFFFLLVSCWRYLAIATTHASSPLAAATLATPRPLDIYFILDKSGSIANYDEKCMRLSGTKCWQVTVNFVEAMVDQLKNVTQGINAQLGLRVGIVWFSGNNGQAVSHSVILPPSGDEATVNKGITKLGGFAPSGGTVMGRSLLDVLNAIRNSPANRPKAVIIETDGLIERSDVTRAMNLAQSIRETGTMIFSVGVGNAITFQDQKTQRTQLRRLSGNQDRVFQISDSLALSKIVQIISALTFNEFDADFASDVDASRYCNLLGDASPSPPPLNIVLTGASVDAVNFGPTYSQRLQCVFTPSVGPFQGTIFTSEAMRSATNNDLTCLLPDPASSFPISSSPNRSSLDAPAPLARVTRLHLTLIETATNIARQILFEKILVMPLPPTCVSLSQNNNPTRCAGESLRVVVSGDYLASLLSASSSSSLPTCAFSTVQAFLSPSTPFRGLTLKDTSNLTSISSSAEVVSDQTYGPSLACTSGDPSTSRDRGVFQFSALTIPELGLFSLDLGGGFGTFDPRDPVGSSRCGSASIAFADASSHESIPPCYGSKVSSATVDVLASLTMQYLAGELMYATPDVDYRCYFTVTDDASSSPSLLEPCEGTSLSLLPLVTSPDQHVSVFLLDHHNGYNVILRLEGIPIVPEIDDSTCGSAALPGACQGVDDGTTHDAITLAGRAPVWLAGTGSSPGCVYFAPNQSVPITAMPASSESSNWIRCPLIPEPFITVELTASFNASAATTVPVFRATLPRAVSSLPGGVDSQLCIDMESVWSTNLDFNGNNDTCWGDAKGAGGRPAVRLAGDSLPSVLATYGASMKCEFLLGTGNSPSSFISNLDPSTNTCGMPSSLLLTRSSAILGGARVLPRRDNPLPLTARIRVGSAVVGTRNSGQSLPIPMSLVDCILLNTLSTTSGGESQEEDVMIGSASGGFTPIDLSSSSPICFGTSAASLLPSLTLSALSPSVELGGVVQCHFYAMLDDDLTSNFSRRTLTIVEPTATGACLLPDTVFFAVSPHTPAPKYKVALDVTPLDTLDVVLHSQDITSSSVVLTDSASCGFTLSLSPSSTSEPICWGQEFVIVLSPSLLDVVTRGRGSVTGLEYECQATFSLLDGSDDDDARVSLTGVAGLNNNNNECMLTDVLPVGTWTLETLSLIQTDPLSRLPPITVFSTSPLPARAIEVKSCVVLDTVTSSLCVGDEYQLVFRGASLAAPSPFSPGDFTLILGNRTYVDAIPVVDNGNVAGIAFPSVLISLPAYTMADIELLYHRDAGDTTRVDVQGTGIMASTDGATCGLSLVETGDMSVKKCVSFANPPPWFPLTISSQNLSASSPDDDDDDGSTSFAFITESIEDVACRYAAQSTSEYVETSAALNENGDVTCNLQTFPYLPLVRLSLVLKPHLGTETVALFDFPLPKYSRPRYCINVTAENWCTTRELGVSSIGSSSFDASIMTMGVRDVSSGVITVASSPDTLSMQFPPSLSLQDDWTAVVVQLPLGVNSTTSSTAIPIQTLPSCYLSSGDDGAGHLTFPPSSLPGVPPSPDDSPSSSSSTTTAFSVAAVAGAVASVVLIALLGVMAVTVRRRARETQMRRDAIAKGKFVWGAGKETGDVEEDVENQMGRWWRLFAPPSPSRHAVVPRTVVETMNLDEEREALGAASVGNDEVGAGRLRDREDDINASRIVLPEWLRGYLDRPLLSFLGVMRPANSSTDEAGDDVNVTTKPSSQPTRGSEGLMIASVSALNPIDHQAPISSGTPSPTKKLINRDVPSSPVRPLRVPRFGARVDLGEAASKDVVTLHLDARSGLGVTLGKTSAGEIVVEAFQTVRDGEMGPIEASNAVCVGDLLVKVDGRDCRRWSLRKIAEFVHAKHGRASRANRDGEDRQGVEETNEENPAPPLKMSFKRNLRVRRLGGRAYEVTLPVEGVTRALEFHYDLVRRKFVLHDVCDAYLEARWRGAIRPGDVLTAIDGKPVPEEEAVARALGERRGSASSAPDVARVLRRLLNEGVKGNNPGSGVRLRMQQWEGGARPPLSPEKKAATGEVVGWIG